MAMNTWLQMIDAAEWKALKKDPSRINRMNKPASESCSTYDFCAINYFLTGDAYPSGSKSKPLATFLAGLESVECKMLENGYLHLVPAAVAQPIAAALEKVDANALKTRIAAADDDDLQEAEVYDVETLGEDDDRGAVVLEDIERLRAFYKAAAKKNCGVVIYTS